MNTLRMFNQIFCGIKSSPTASNPFSINLSKNILLDMVFLVNKSFGITNKIGLVAVLALAILIGVLFVFEFRGPAYEQPLVALVLQIVFVLAIGLIVVFVSAKSYLQFGSLNVLLIGNAILISSLSTTLSVVALSPVLTPFLTTNEATTIGNLGILISSFVLLLSATLTFFERSPIMPTNRKTVLATTLFVSLLLVAVIGISVDFDLLPAFLTSTGPTLLRIFVLSFSAIFYFASASLFTLRYLRRKSQVLYWYSLGLLLFGLALIAGVLTWKIGDVMNWTARVATYLSSVYFLIAVLSPQTQLTTEGYSGKWTEAFRADQKQLAGLFANMRESFIYCKTITDQRGKPVDWVFIDVNEAYTKLTGLTRENTIGKRVTELFPNEPKDPSDWIGRYGKVALTCEPTHFESYRQSIGKWLSVSAYSPKKGFFVSIFDDVTERKKAEETLKRSEENYRSLFSNLTDGFAYCKMLFDLQGNPVDFVYLQINDAFERITGLKREQVVGKNVTKAIAGIEKANPELFAIYGRVATTGKAERFELYFKPLSMWLSILVYSPEKGFFAAVFEDITERKKVQEEVARVASFPTLNPNPIVELDSNGHISYSNPSAKGLFPDLEELGLSHPILFDWQKVVKVFDLTSSGTFRREVKVGKQWYYQTLFPVPNTKLIRIYSIDITDRKEAEEALKQAQEKLQEYAISLERLVEERTKQLQDSERLAAIGQTAGMVGHDIRNPLQAIVGDLYLLKLDLEDELEGEKKQSVTETIEGINDNIAYINKIVADLQDYARKTEPSFAEIDLEKAINDTFTTINVPENIKVQCTVEPNTKLKTDPSYIRRIITNLSLNAIQAMPNGGKLLLDAKRKDSFVQIALSDTGEGIPKDVQEKVFKPLFTTKAKGQGFGLAVVKKFVEELGGNITFSSTQGKGTTFIIMLPIDDNKKKIVS